MNIEASTRQGKKQHNEALLKVAMQPGGGTRRGRLPQVHYGFDKDKFRDHAREIWDRLPKDGGLPSIEALKSVLLPMFRVHSILISLTGDGSDARIAYLGLAVAEMAGIKNRSDVHQLTDAPPSSVLSELPRLCGHVGRAMKPIEFKNLTAEGPSGDTVFNGILLPFGDQRGDALHIFAVLDCLDHSSEDKGVLDLTSEYFAEEPVDTLELQVDQILADAELEAVARRKPDLAAAEEGPPTLADALVQAREFAEYAQAFERRSHMALYAAVSKAYDFALQAAASPDEFAALLEESGIAMQERAPMTPIVKLVFGKEFDRTRVTEYATVLTYAVEKKVQPGGMMAFLQAAEGGIKGIVAEARSLRRGEEGPAPARGTIRPATAKKLRTLYTNPLDEIRLKDQEFGLVMVRQMEDGTVRMVGPVSDDAAMIEKLGKKMLAAM